MENQAVEQPAIPETEQHQSSSIALITLTALAAAVVGAIAWAAIVYFSNYELGLVAWAIGGLVGFAVAYAAKQRVTQAHQVVAVIFSLAGVLAGKYASYYLIVKKTEEEMGFSLQGLISFSDMFEAYDILWVALAAYTAWSVPQRMAPSQRSSESN